MTEQEENIITISPYDPCAIATEHGKKMLEKLKEDWEKMKEALSENFSELKKLYPDHTDLSFQTDFTNHWHIWIDVGMGYVVSVVQEQMFSKTNNLEYALLYLGDFIYLEEHGDTVARFQTLQQVIDFIERVKKEKGEQHEQSNLRRSG